MSWMDDLNLSDVERRRLRADARSHECDSVEQYARIVLWQAMRRQLSQAGYAACPPFPPCASGQATA